MPTESLNNKLRVGSRKSQLALIQTEFVIGELKKICPDYEFEIVEMSTLGDNVLDKALSKIGEKSLFTKELEVALEKGEVEFVVHSLKDLPTTLPPGMVIGAVMEREDPRDAVIMRLGHSANGLKDLKEGSVIGTSSLRRSAQLKAKFPHLMFQDVRGNLNTRLKKLDDPEGPYSALILAAAGVSRMGWSDRVTQYLESDTCLYAVGQGALAVECRDSDSSTLALLAKLHHRETVVRTVSERVFMRTLEGGCSVPVAVCSQLTESGVKLTGGVWSLDGSQSVASTKHVKFVDQEAGDREDSPMKKLKTEDGSYAGISVGSLLSLELEAAEKCGGDLAAELLSKGAGDILTEVKSAAIQPINQPPAVK